MGDQAHEDFQRIPAVTALTSSSQEPVDPLDHRSAPTSQAPRNNVAMILRSCEEAAG